MHSNNDYDDAPLDNKLEMESWLCQGAVNLLSNKHYRTLLTITCLTILVSACQYLPADKADSLPPVASTTVEVNNETTSAVLPEKQNGIITSNGPRHRQRQQQILEMGSGNFIGTPKHPKAQTTETDEGDITLNFQDTDLR